MAADTVTLPVHPDQLPGYVTAILPDVIRTSKAFFGERVHTVQELQFAAGLVCAGLLDCIHRDGGAG